MLAQILIPVPVVAGDWQYMICMHSLNLQCMYMYMYKSVVSSLRNYSSTMGSFNKLTKSCGDISEVGCSIGSQVECWVV